MRIFFLMLLIWVPNWLVYSQPGCGMTCINIQEWRTAGQMVKVEIGLLSNGQKLRSFMVSETDSLVSFGHTTDTMYCTLKMGHKVIKLVIDSLDCDSNYYFSLTDSLKETINLIPTEAMSERGCSNRRSILLLVRKEN